MSNKIVSILLILGLVTAVIYSYREGYRYGYRQGACDVGNELMKRENLPPLDICPIKFEEGKK